MNYRSIRRSMRRNPGGETIFTLFFADGNTLELRAPGNPRRCLNWLLQRMNDPLHPDAIAARACESYTSSDGSRILDLVRSSDSAEQQAAREPEQEQVLKLRHEIEVELGLVEVEEPQAEEPPPADAPNNLIAMPKAEDIQ
jgi:hypothetical protein